MKILDHNLVKSSILELMHGAREYLYICTFSYDITNFETFEFIQLIQRNVRIELIAGKEIPTEVFSKFAKLYNISVYQLPDLHSKIYFSEEEAISCSCNFGNLTVPRLYESGIQFSRKDYRTQYQQLKEQVMFLISQASTVLPIVPFNHEGGIDLREFITSGSRPLKSKKK